MPDLELVIRAADAVLLHGRSEVDIGVDADGRIRSIAPPRTLNARTIVDAAGLVALPGGVDLHVHINTFFGGTTTRDDFLSGTSAALFGGTTTVGQFAIPRPGETSLDAVQRTMAEAGPTAVGDYAIHGAMVRETFTASLDQLHELRASGIRTIKVFSAYTDSLGLTLGEIHRLLERAAAYDVTVFVHAETDSLIVEAIAAAVRAGHTGPDGHAASRTSLAEADAIRSISDLARVSGARIYVVHVSGAPSVSTLRERRDAGDFVLAETCPHYLFLDEAVYAQPDGGRWICSPPIRSAEHREALWDGLVNGVIDTVSSDHNCFDRSQKGDRGTDFRHVPNGLPGIETRLPLLIDAAIEGRLSWNRLAEVASETPARILGLWPRKGTLAEGADADIVLVDPTAEAILGVGHMATDFSPYEGRRVRGQIRSVFRRGDRVVNDGVLAAPPGSGTWLPITAAPSHRPSDRTGPAHRHSSAT